MRGKFPVNTSDLMADDILKIEDLSARIQGFWLNQTQ